MSEKGYGDGKKGLDDVTYADGAQLVRQVPETAPMEGDARRRGREGAPYESCFRSSL